MAHNRRVDEMKREIAFLRFQPPPTIEACGITHSCSYIGWFIDRWEAWKTSHNFRMMHSSSAHRRLSATQDDLPTFMNANSLKTM